MQKKIKLRLADIVFVLICLAGAGYSLYKFYEELYRTLEKQNESPIAQIVIKENIAQRKFADGTVWDRLRTQANIYEGDTIHTTAKSLAAVQFIDDNSIELGENTLIRVHLKKEKDGSGSTIEMDSGSITVNAFDSAISIKSGDSIITIGENSTLTAKNSENSEMSLFLMSGNASIQNGGQTDSSVNLQAGQVVTFDAEGNTVAVVPQDVIDTLESLYAEAPVLIAPAANYKTSYRTKKPTIRFIWSQLNLANSYQLEIADNPQMRNPVFSQRVLQTSRIMNDLSNGTWYWRVTPYYQLNRRGFGTPSEVSSFKIELNSVLEKPVLLMPRAGDLVTTRMPLDNGSYVYKGVTLSWKENPEAINYRVVVWNNGDSAPLVNTVTTKNFYEIDTSKVNLKNGRWKWKVTLYDAEGNSKECDAREFVAIDDVVEQRTIYPPDGFRLSEGRTADTRYSWKSNIPTETVFELSKDANFKNIIYRQATTGNSAVGRSMQPGTYYWRIRADLESVELKTKPKTIIVEPPMPAPAFVKPGNGQVAVVRPDRPFELRWGAVEGADYYQIKIFSLNNPDNILFQQNYIESTSLKMNFGSWAERSYGISIQAFRDETALYSRAASYLGNYSFRIVQIKPIELVSPQDGKVIDGVNAVQRPEDFEWNYVGVPYKSEIVIYKGAILPENEFMRIKNPGMKLKMPVFYEGTYYWTVEGYTEDDYDISVGHYRNFSVTPIEKMPMPVVIEPKNRRTFDKDYFRETRLIRFEWKPVEKADRYVLKLYSPSNELIVEKILNKNETKFEFDELAKLSVGTFTWSLEAQTLWGDVVFQNGIESVQSFRVSLPSIKTPKTTDEGIRYGK